MDKNPMLSCFDCTTPNGPGAIEGGIPKMIYGFDDRFRIQRQGKIRIGQKVVSESKDGKVFERPVALDYFVGPPEVHRVYGERPRKLDILIPSENLDEVFDTSLRWYGKSGLKCVGNGRNASRYDEESLEWREVVCPYHECPFYKSGHCTEVGSFQFILPKVPGAALSVYQIDTGSYNSTLNIKATLALLKSTLGRISLIPLVLEVRMEEKNPIDPRTGKRITSKVPVLYLTTPFTFEELLEAARRNRLVQQLNLGVDVGRLPSLPPIDLTKPEELYPADMNGGALEGGELPSDRVASVGEPVPPAMASQVPGDGADHDELEAELHRLWDLLGTTPAKRRIELSKPNVDLAALLSRLQAEVKRRGLDQKEIARDITRANDGAGGRDASPDTSSDVRPDVQRDDSRDVGRDDAGDRTSAATAAGQAKFF